MQIRLPCLVLLVCFLWFTTHDAYANYGSKLCKLSGFYCYRVKRGQSWSSIFPNEHERSIARRINRMNTTVYPGMLLAIPENLDNADIMQFSPFERQITSTGEKLIVIDPINLAWGAYDANGTLVRWGPASSGADYCRDIDSSCQTRSGEFRIFSLGSSDCFSTKFPLPRGGAPMPFCMYFNNGQALHGEPNGLPGYNASHGCVRLYVNDAEWLRYDFVEGPDASNNYRGTRVLVKEYENPINDDVNENDNNNSDLDDENE